MKDDLMLILVLYKKFSQNKTNEAMHDFIEIQEKIVILKSFFEKTFKDKPYTVNILLWNDGDYRLELRHGVDDKVFVFRYDKSDDKISGLEEVMLSKAIKVDALGNHYYVPEELIPYLNDRIQTFLMATDYTPDMNSKHYA